MDQEPSDAELERLLGARKWLGVSGKEAILERVLEKTAASAPARGRLWAALAATGLAAAGLAVAFVLPVTPELTARGGSLRPSFTVSCVQDGHPAPCTRGASAVFDVSPAGYGAFGAVMEAPDGTTVWIFPGGTRGLSVDTRALGAHGVLSEALKLEGPAGAYVIHGVFSAQPLGKDQLRQVLQEPDASGAATQSQRLELP